MKSIFLKKLFAMTLLFTFAIALKAEALDMSVTYQVSTSKSKVLLPVATYNSGMSDEDGGVEEIVAYNSDNGNLYSVNGKAGLIDIIYIGDINSNVVELKELTNSINVKDQLVAFIKGTQFEAFSYGDMTSVAISTKHKYVAVSVQDSDYTKNGIVVFMDYQGNIKRVEMVGIQPDMITFSPDENILLTANEGEPREGYLEGSTDPKGSVTIIELNKKSASVNKSFYKDEAFNSENVPDKIVGKDGKTYDSMVSQKINPKGRGKEGYGFLTTTLGFEYFDPLREDLTSKGVIIKKYAKISEDLEPEYITIDRNSKYAYITLQENNSIAVMDLKTKKYVGIYPLGFKNHNLKGNEIDLKKNKKIKIKNEDAYGIFMPDAIVCYDYKGETYLVTANEGDSREWGDYSNEIEIDDIVYFDKSQYDGLDGNKNYIFGGRSFSIWKLKDGALYQIYDSGSAFEMATADVLPDFFNTSNSNLKKDNRSGKKGPEPEGVTIITDKCKLYAAIGVERIGGIFLFDVTNPYKVIYESYINTRNFEEDILGDVAPEGLLFIPAIESPTGKALVTAAFEVSGTVTVFELK